MSNANCCECMRLWREYRAATVDWSRAEDQLNLADLDALPAAIVRAEETKRRVAAREALRAHREDTGHTQSQGA